MSPALNGEKTEYLEIFATIKNLIGYLKISLDLIRKIPYISLDSE